MYHAYFNLAILKLLKLHYNQVRSKPSEHAVGELTRQVVRVLKELGWTPPAIPGSFTSHDRSHQPSLVKTGFKPDLYDGSKPWTDYKMHFDAVSQANNWDYRAAGLALAASLRGSAQCVLEESPGRDYGELVDLLEMEFGDGNRAQVYEMQLRGRVQGTQEDFPAFARAVKVLARKAYPMAGTEAIGIAALGQFQDGLRNERVREMVIFGAPLTLRAAVDLAIRADVSLTRARVVPQQPRQFRQLEQQQQRNMMQVRRPIANNNDAEQGIAMPALGNRMVCYRFAEASLQPGETIAVPIVGPLFPSPSIANNEPSILPALDDETPVPANPPSVPSPSIDELLKGPEQPSEHAVGELTRQVVRVLKELGWTPPVIPGSFTSHDRSHQPSLVKTGFKPDLYDGSKPWTDYKMHFDAVSQANNWDYRAAGLALAASLRGSAQCVLEESPGRDYGELVDLLEMEFGDGNRAQVYEMQLRGRVQGTQEDFPAFARAVKVLARKAYPMAGTEAIGIAALGQFQDGLRNERVREMVIFGAPLTLRAAVDLAIRADVSLTRARVVPQQPRQFRQLEQQQQRNMMQVRRPIANNNDAEQGIAMPALGNRM
ncbi:hypothetical protein GE061_006114, partial [Apolygus lucorum]